MSAYFSPNALASSVTFCQYYDSMILKVIVHDKTRTEAIRKMETALGEIIIDGVDTNLDFLYEIISHEKFIAGDISTHFIHDYFNM